MNFSSESGLEGDPYFNKEYLFPIDSYGSSSTPDYLNNNNKVSCKKENDDDEVFDPEDNYPLPSQDYSPEYPDNEVTDVATFFSDEKDKTSYDDQEDDDPDSTLIVMDQSFQAETQQLIAIFENPDLKEIIIELLGGEEDGETNFETNKKILNKIYEKLKFFDKHNGDKYKELCASYPIRTFKIIRFLKYAITARAKIANINILS